VLPAVLTIILCSLVGAAALAHPYENRSTGFRVFGFAIVLGVVAWLVFLVFPNIPFGPGRDSEALWYTSGFLGAVLALFPLFAATEAPKLTPRVVTRLPRSALLRFLSVPFLPGCGRGLVYTLLLAPVSLVVPLLFEASGWRRGDADAPGIALLIWAYVIFYSAVAAFVRSRMGQAQKYNWIARAIPVGMLLLAIVLPLLAEVILGARSIGRWAFYRILDPFTTVSAHDGYPREPEEVLGIFLVLTAIAVAMNFVSMWDGVSEVMSARRRPRGTR
jgi:hypothetical protein